MDRKDIAYLINSTPKYFYILELHVALLRRYAPQCKWPVYFATELPEDPICKILKNYDVTTIPLEKVNSSFLASRKRALELLPESIKYVLPMQEDFLLERNIDTVAIEDSLNIFDNDSNVIAIRYMPCPGPKEINANVGRFWKLLQEKFDTYLFSFQATMWKREYCLSYYKIITTELDAIGFEDTKRNHIEVKQNIAENSDGQKLYAYIFKDKKTLGYIRTHKYPNAVYMSPWPYRPTAIIKGKLQDFAKEVAEREGYTLKSVP
jgi:hypothetical protein